MKVSLVLHSAIDARDFAAQAQAQLEAAELQVELELITPDPEQQPTIALFHALSSCSGEWIAALGPVAEPGSVLALLQAQRSLRDRELTAVMLEAKLSGAARYSHTLHRVLCRLGGKRSAPRGDSSVLFQRRWLPALRALPVTPEWDLPLALAVLGVQWERVWTPRAPAGASPVVAGAQLSGWRRLLLLGALFELGLVGAVALYALASALIIMGSRSTWAVKGSVGIALGALLVLAFGTVQLLARRKLRPALALSADAQAALVSPDTDLPTV